MRIRNRVLLGLVSFAVLGIIASTLQAASYDESVSGDLSNNQAAPTSLALAVGLNSIKGNVNGAAGDSQDFIKLTVPAGAEMTSYVHAAYSSTDLQGFTGFQAGSSFVGSPFSANSYGGFAHYGSNATGNGPGAQANTVGQDLFTAPYFPFAATQGAAPFSAPLGPGDYTFLIQQLGASTNYEFDVTVVPEPAALCLMTLGGLMLLAPAASKLRRKSC